MKRPQSIPALVGAIALAALIGSFWLSPHVRAADSGPIPLPDEDRQALNQYLGWGVVGDAVVPPILNNGLNDLISIQNGLSWNMQVTSGKGKGSQVHGSANILERPGDNTRFRFDTGDGRNVLFGQLDAQGNLNCYAAQDNQQGVISQFSPAEPIFIADIAPGETRNVSFKVSVADLSNPGREEHSGELSIAYTYVGAYHLQVPAGAIDAMMIKSHITGKVGPASIDNTVYRFFAKNHGPVAMVESDNVSAMFIYHDSSRVGRVLVSTTNN